MYIIIIGISPIKRSALTNLHKICHAHNNVTLLLLEFHQGQLPLQYRNASWNKIFANVVKVAISSVHAIINTEKIVCEIKFLPMRTGAKLGENFFLAKISGYTINNNTSTCDHHIPCTHRES